MIGELTYTAFPHIEERWTRMEQGDCSPNEMLRILGLAMDDISTLRAMVKELREENQRLEERNALYRGRIEKTQRL